MKEITPEFIKFCCEYAEGFEWRNKFYFERLCEQNYYYFPLLLHRAVEGWNKKQKDGFNIINIDYEKERVDILINKYPMPEFKKYIFSDYQPSTLTVCEQAACDCLYDIFEEVGK